VTIPIVDMHQHLIYPEKWTYSWTKGIPKLEGHAFRMDDYLREIEGTGISRSVFMETTPDAWHEEAAHVYDLAAQPGSIITGVIANCHPEEDGFEEYLDSIHNDKLVGLRRICHVEHDEFSRQPKFVDNISRLSRRGSRSTFAFSPGNSRLPWNWRRNARMCNSSSTTVVYPISRVALSIRGVMTFAGLPGCPMSHARFPEYLPIAHPAMPRLRRCGPTSSTVSNVLDGIAWCGAATGRFARLPALCGGGSQPRLN
jgi:hypothetical protein